MDELQPEPNEDGPHVTFNMIAQCLSGEHGPPGPDNKCSYCDAPLGPLPEKLDDMAVHLPPIDQAAVAPPGQTKTVVCANGPLGGVQLINVPLDATVLCEVYSAASPEPYFGTLYRPYIAREAYYRCTGGKAWLMFTRDIA